VSYVTRVVMANNIIESAEAFLKGYDAGYKDGRGSGFLLGSMGVLFVQIVVFLLTWTVE